MRSPRRLADSDKALLLEILQRLYAAFDANQDGQLDYSELVSGLGVLCAGSGDDRVGFTWELFDYNGDGYISRKKWCDTSPQSTASCSSLSPASLRLLMAQPKTSRATTDQAFSNFGQDDNDLLDYDEFMEWYRQGKSMAATGGGRTLADARALLKLHSFDANDVFELFAIEAGDDGMVSKESYDRVFSNLVKDDKDASELASRVFALFDDDESGTVDFQNLCAGLSVFTGGDKKAEKSFKLYDIDDSGAVDMKEMVSYLTCVFKVMYLFEAPSSADVTPEQLAQVTASEIFDTYDLDNNNVLSFEEFQLWASGEEITLEQARKLTGLENHASEDIFEELALTAGSDGLVSRAHFVEVLTRCASSPLGVKIGERVFNLFAESDTDACDFNDISSALSVLCGGDANQRAEAAFFSATTTTRAPSSRRNWPSTSTASSRYPNFSLEAAGWAARRPASSPLQPPRIYSTSTTLIMTGGWTFKSFWRGSKDLLRLQSKWTTSLRS